MNAIHRGPVLLLHPGIYDGHDPHVFPPWGALCVGQAVRQSGFDVVVADLNGQKPDEACLSLIESIRPTAVGFTAKIGNGQRRFRKAADAARQAFPMLPIAVGGPLVSLFPDVRHPIWGGSASALFWGDGDGDFGRWLESGARTVGVFGPDRQTDLDRVGIPTWWEGLARYVRPAEYWPNFGVPAIHVAASRDCTSRCTFCYLNKQFPERGHRVPSPSTLVRDMGRLSARFGVQGFYFVDDCLIDHPPTLMRELCWHLIAAGSPYRLGCDIQLRELPDTDLLELMYLAGFRSLYLGLEAASPTVRARLGKGSSQPLRGRIRRVLDMGFAIRASVGIGWPGETEAEMRDTLRLVSEIPDLAFDAYRYLPLPGVPLTDRWLRDKHDTISDEELATSDYSNHNRNFSDLADESYEDLWQEMKALESRSLERYARTDTPSAVQPSGGQPPAVPSILTRQGSSSGTARPRLVDDLLGSNCDRPIAQLRKAARSIARASGARPGRMDGGTVHLDWLRPLAIEGSHQERLLAGLVIEEFARHRMFSSQLAYLVVTLADDQDWDVREGAQLALRAAAAADFRAVVSILRACAASPSANVRRAALLGVRPSPRTTESEAKERLSIVDALIDDKATYVRRNIPYALGFWRHHPQLLREQVAAWARSPRAEVRRNVAASLQGRLFMANTSEWAELLRILQVDSDAKVRVVASRSAKRNAQDGAIAGHGHAGGEGERL